MIFSVKHIYGKSGKITINHWKTFFYSWLFVVYRWTWPFTFNNYFLRFFTSLSKTKYLIGFRYPQIPQRRYPIKNPPWIIEIRSGEPHTMGATSGRPRPAHHHHTRRHSEMRRQSERAITERGERFCMTAHTTNNMLRDQKRSQEWSVYVIYDCTDNIRDVAISENDLLVELSHNPWLKTNLVIRKVVINAKTYRYHPGLWFCLQDFY